MNSETMHNTGDDNFFIPRLDSNSSVALLVIVAELLALVLSVLNSGLQQFSWEWLGIISFYVQWVVLLSAAALQRLRPYFCRIPMSMAATLSYALVLFITGFVSVVGQMLWLDVDFMQSADSHWRLFQHLLVAAVLFGITWRYFYIQFLLRRQQQARLVAKIDALQARIQPHFLFNSMNSIASLISVDPDSAEQAVEDLCDLFRASLSHSSVLVALEDELSLCRGYLRIEKLRMGRRLEVEWQLQGLPLAAMKIPSLCLQPLIENAVYHGISSRPDGGCITIHAERRGDSCVFTISNPLGPASEEHEGHHMAVENIRSRLQAIYDGRASLKLAQRQGTFTALLTLPVDAEQPLTGERHG
jgi:two-component system sensor histidine kinase AlgZ